MQKHVLVSVDNYETRIAVLENSVLVEYYFERSDQRRLMGNIYKGRVTSIVEGIDAAFVDIGQGRNAFLFVSDVLPPSDTIGLDLAAEEDSSGHFPFADREESSLPTPSICDVLKVGQEVLVQVSKEPIGSKGSRVTTAITLPGRFLVLLPATDHIGISRRIDEPGERERLRKIAKGLVPSRMGVILRTNGEGRPASDFEEDIRFLLAQWERIRKLSESNGAPSMIHEEMVITHRLARDVLTDDVTRVVVDNGEMYRSLLEYVQAVVPAYAPKIKMHEGGEPLFKAFGVDAQVLNLRQKKVWLNCGGYVVIDEAEALTAIDVNTGKFLGSRNLEETVVATNLEAASEIARQIRLRDIGGIIVIDFIDMQKPENQKMVLTRLQESFKRDRARTEILSLTKLGLVEMTRKRVRKSLNKIMTQPCPYCKAEGTILSFTTMTIRALRKIETLCEESSMKEIRVYLHPKLAQKLVEDRHEDIERMEKFHRKAIRIFPAPNLHFEDIRDGFSYDTAFMLELT